MTIKITRNEAANCINFVGSTNPAYFNACLSAVINDDDSDRVDIINDVRTGESEGNQYEFYAVHYTGFSDKDGTAFSNAQEMVDYVNANANVANNTGRFILSDTDYIDFSVDPTETTVLLDNGDAYAVNSIRAVENDDGNIDVLKHSSDVIIYGDLRSSNASIDGAGLVGTTPTVVNQLNSLFENSGGIGGSAPVITSPSTISLTIGEIINYELTATDGVAYEWENLPTGVTTVDGNVRKIIGGSTLTAGTYTFTAKALNYYGESTQTISLVVSAPAFADTKSIKFLSNDYLGANAALLDGVLGRSGNGAGASDAWSISMWFKPGSDTTGQTVFYYGSNSVTTGGHIEVRYVGGGNKLSLKYGSSYNHVQLRTPNGSVASSDWVHLLLTYDGGTTGASSGALSSYYSRFKIYIDGVLQTTSNTHSNYGWSGAISGQNLRVGRYDSGNYLKNCLVDELAVWDSDQSGAVSDIYNSGATHALDLLSSPPSHWWRMGDGDTYPTIQDNIGTAHFVMYNMTAADIVSDTP